jgi:hypothetical protein
VTALLSTTIAAEATTTLTWFTPDGAEERLRLTEAWPARFEDGLPVRQLRARKGQRHLSGLWWSATMGRHLGFKSWLERDHAMLLDFDSAVVGIASQPFWLSWRDSGGGSVSHCPDYFVRRADGSAVVVDCRPVDRRPDKDIAKFDATAAVCGELGWGYDLVGATEPVLTANVRWLAGYPIPATTRLILRRGCKRCSPSRCRWSTVRAWWAIRSGCCRRCSVCCGAGSWSAT